MAVVLAKILNLPPGDLATWVSSLLVAATLIILLMNAKQQQVDTRRRIQLDRSSQARLVGGWISRSWDITGSARINFTIQNASPLAVRDVRGYLYEHPDGKFVAAFDPIPVVEPGKKTIGVSRTSFPDVFLVIAFDDDEGIRWRKYAGKPLTELKRTLPDWQNLDKKFEPGL
jgi:hypothetical protein